MKVLMITDGINPFVIGGMQKHSANLAKHLTLSGCKVTLVHCVDQASKLPSDKQINQILFNGRNNLDKIIGLKFPRSIWFPGHYIYNSYLYSKIIFEGISLDISQYDFIYAKGFTAWKFILEKKKGLKMPKIGVKFHGYEMYQTSSGIKIKLQHWMLRFFVKWNNINADLVFSYGSKITDIILKLGVKASNVIEVTSGIDGSWLTQKSLDIKSPIRFVYLGRYERRKGIEEISLAIENLIHKNVSAEFHFVGPIPDDKKINLKSSHLNYHGRLMDFQKIKDVLDSSDVLICPSYSEGMPNVILEAMARGLVIITTDVGANSLMVGEDNGLLLNNSNHKTIQKGMEYILSMDENKLLDKKLSSLKKIKKSFLWNEIAKETIKKIKSKINT